jgi:hypothetical protein
MNGINLPDIIGQQSMPDDIFNENFDEKTKKMQLDQFANDELKVAQELDKFGNNNHIKLDKPENLKKSYKNTDNEYITTELNINIEKNSNKTITLELRHLTNDISLNNYKNANCDIENANENAEIGEYNLKDGDDIRMGVEKSTNDDMGNQNGEYVNGNESQENEVS